MRVLRPSASPYHSGSVWAAVRLLALLLVAGLVLTAAHVVLALGADPAAIGIAGYQVPAPFAPGDPEILTMPGSAGLATTASITGKCLRVSCSTAASFRVGTSALAYPDGGANVNANYNEMNASTPESMCLSGTQTTLAFYTASAGTCRVAARGP